MHIAGIIVTVTDVISRLFMDPNYMVNKDFWRCMDKVDHNHGQQHVHIKMILSQQSQIMIMT